MGGSFLQGILSLSVSCSLLEREEVEGRKLQSARAMSEIISAGPGHPRGAHGPGG